MAARIISIPRSPALPVLAAALGIALFTLMDAVMKGESLAIGAYCAMLWRTAIGTITAGALLFHEPLRRPSAEAWRLHLQRGAVTALSATGYFFGLTRLPMAEGIALSFIAPLVALYLAAALLGEPVGRRAIAASLLSLAGVVLLLGSRAAGRFDGTALVGAVAILGSAAVYGYGLILLRRQAQLATPIEVSFFQNAMTLLWLLPGAYWLAPLPAAHHWPGLAVGALLGQMSIMLIAWAYARVEARMLIPLEYSAFLWSALFGALFFGERLTPMVVAGGALIVAGCVASTRTRPQPLAAEVSL